MDYIDRGQRKYTSIVDAIFTYAKTQPSPAYHNMPVSSALLQHIRLHLQKVIDTRYKDKELSSAEKAHKLDRYTLGHMRKG